MYMASVALAASGEARHRELDPNLVVDLLWALAEPGLGIEHMRVTTGPGHIEVVFFSAAPDAQSVAVTGIHLCETATSSAPQLQGWYVVRSSGNEEPGQQ